MRGSSLAACFGTFGHNNCSLCGGFLDPDAERVVAAAIEFDGEVVSEPSPARHGDIIRLRAGRSDPPTRRSGRQGFLTNRGRFVDREEARSIAVEAGQCVAPNHGTMLFTEDLW